MGLGLAIAILVGMQGQAKADLYSSVSYTTTAASDSDGAVSATITFSAVNGGLEITVTNNETGTLAKGQAISEVDFTIANSSLGHTTGFTSF